MDTRQYLLVLGSCVTVTLPLEIIGGARVCRRTKALLATLAPVVAVFGGWDLIAAEPRRPLPGFSLLARGRRSWDERFDAAREWVSWPAR